jgi:hypothetical protein
MNDGIIFCNLNFIPMKPFVIQDTRSYDWNDIGIMDFRGESPTLKTSGVTSSWPLVRHSRFVPYDKIAEDLYVDQRHGKIPQNVVIFQPQALAKPAKTKSWLEKAVFFVFMVAVVAIGYPFYVGGGSLLQAVAPGLVAIGPDASELAISRHPEWPFTKKLELRAITTALSVAQLTSLTEFFGLRRNTLDSLWFVPVFWTMQFASRETQVDLLAHIIANDKK